MAGLSAIRSDPASAVIGLDFDGTLAPIVPDPADARVAPDAAAALVRLGALVGAVVIVTGRPAATAIAYGHVPGGPGLADVPGLVVLGQYGLERWESGLVTSPPPPPGVDRVRAELPALLTALGLPPGDGEAPGVTVEDKGRAVAVHTRRAADPEGALRTLREPLAALAAAHGLVVEPGRLVLELRPSGMDKGQALLAFLAERGAGSVLFGGDDLGDLAAFEAVRDSGLPGVTVCSASAEVSELAALADVVVDGPRGVASLLSALADALSGR
ncbi:trehalose-phosphatase [Sphaerisporangium sp. TRM90804]|uniref:trehalose-phosphatase n=1 Tax=Sphaerisporangium sp. TRM90804 TaxID=3031113 RepID=UPI00244999F7|nr:trehalose-phosphatase [Sphaerisporangium sp. TRM90804]MDH2430427.1 trehalose-phosphatase [Sphaerisporangium sp. TRM90804]